MTADGGGLRHRPGWAENDLGCSARGYGKRDRGGRTAGRSAESPPGFHRAAALYSGWRQGAARGGEEVCRRIGADPTLSSSQTAQCARSLNRRTEVGGGKEAERSLRAGRLRRRQTSAERIASRTHASQSERRT